jgi:hypothetical protein
MVVKNIEKELLGLGVDTRARLATRLLSSLDELSEAENEQLWAQEAFTRHLTSSKTQFRPSALAFKNARRNLKFA